eukprot:TRINITY_DN21611_c0_g1_i2.p1 TRINITY_DN21611_c0_g1~~TRINITY_DN21611_c0_g1_i2.p1  ORF type:complete len:107 (+),score=4.57 TRINITY_DN21611_c0_g1_i2:223-543(+)
MGCSCAPPHLTPRDTRSRTALRTRDHRPKPIIDTIGEFVPSDIRLPYTPAPRYTELRPKTRRPLPGTPRSASRNFCYSGPEMTTPRPLSAKEPWSDRARAEMWGMR